MKAGVLTAMRCVLRGHMLPPDLGLAGLKNGDTVTCPCGGREYEVWIRHSWNMAQPKRWMGVIRREDYP